MDRKTIIAITVVAILLSAGVAGAFFFLKEKEDNRLTIKDLAATGNYLKIFGNANGDYLLDEDDVQIIQDYVDGKITEEDLIVVEETENKNRFYLADANCDGEVNEADIAVLRGIIDRTGSHMYIIDTFGYHLKVPLNIERIVCDYFAAAELLNMCGVQDKIVAASKALLVLKDYYLMNVPDTSKVVNFNPGTGSSVDYEAVAEADPQVWVISAAYKLVHRGNTSAVVLGLDSLVFDFDNVLASGPIMSALLAGYIFNAPEKGIAYVEWYLETWNRLNSKTENLTKEQRPTV
ncbi:MAG: hypothetical protein GX224_03045 [Thermoplasmatales archaeon]|nr:hypothetical protein [Thermoplasmatales archaeon]